MTAPLEITVTNAGRAAIVNAQNTGTAPVTITQIGLSGTAVTPLPTATALAGEFKRVASIAGEVVANDTIHVTLTDSSGDAYTLRSIGLYLADGTLFAIYGQAAPVLEKTAQSIAALAVDVIFADIAAASLTFGDANFTNPPATTERQGVVELATLAEAQAGIDALRALTPSMAKAAILGWLLAQDGSGSLIDSDLLDGQHGAYYADIPARLGFNPLNAVVYTAADVRGKLITVDGSGSGVDSDLLDGEHGSYYRDLTNSTGTLPNARLNGLYSGISIATTGSQWWKNGYAGLDLSNSDIIGVNGIIWGDSANLDEEGLLFPKAGAPAGSQDMADYDCFRGYNGVLYWAGSTIFHSGNDGSGSGADADLLDGQHGSYYRDLVNSTGTLPNARVSGDYDGIGTLTAARGRFTASTDASLISTGHGFQVGPDAGLNIIADGNEIMARNNGFASTLSLNFEGGDVVINGALAWHAGNDGSGSGADADLLDGKDGSWYMQAIPGHIAIFAMAAAPSGYLACNGAAVSRTTYAALFAAIGTTYGAGNGSTTFNLPDARGEFIRGWDNGRGVDAGRAIGTSQGSMLGDHDHFIANTADGSTNLTANTSLTTHGTATGDSEYQLKGSATEPTIGKTSGTGGAETRPRNIAFLVCIKT